MSWIIFATLAIVQASSLTREELLDEIFGLDHDCITDDDCGSGSCSSPGSWVKRTCQCEQPYSGRNCEICQVLRENTLLYTVPMYSSSSSRHVHQLQQNDSKWQSIGPFQSCAPVPDCALLLRCVQCSSFRLFWKESGRDLILLHQDCEEECQHFSYSLQDEITAEGKRRVNQGGKSVEIMQYQYGNVGLLVQAA